MTQDEFKRELGRIAETFGASHFKPEKVKLIWQEVKDLPATSMKCIVDYFIAESRNAPIVSEFRNQVAIQRERIWQEQKHQRIQQVFDDSKCSICHGTGSVLAMRIATRDRFAFKCCCEIGKQSGVRVMMWGPEFEEEYQPL